MIWIIVNTINFKYLAKAWCFLRKQILLFLSTTGYSTWKLVRFVGLFAVSRTGFNDGVAIIKDDLRVQYCMYRMYTKSSRACGMSAVGRLALFMFNNDAISWLITRLIAADLITWWLIFSCHIQRFVTYVTCGSQSSLIKHSSLILQKATVAHIIFSQE